MKCPIDDTVLVMSERRGIEIDYCPTCRGVWLDRGELNKLIASDENTQAQTPESDNHSFNGSMPKHHSDYSPHKKYKKGSLLGELFDL